MRAKLLQVYWHERQPVYSLSFDHEGRLATAGGDNTIRIWNFNHNKASLQEIKHLSSLKKHLRAVNCVQFHPTGRRIDHTICAIFVLDNILASGGDGGTLILWKLFPNSDPSLDATKSTTFGADESEITENVENWIPVSLYRVSDNEDIYDLKWCPRGELLILGLTDNNAVIWNIKQGRCVRSLREHGHFVQGVAWDPLSSMIVTQSSDRMTKNRHMSTKCIQTLSKIPQCSDESIPKATHKKIFHDETLVSFFRRPSFSPDGSLLAVPCGLLPPCGFSSSSPFTPCDAQTVPTLHCVYVYSRASLLSVHTAIPMAHFGPFEKAAVVTKFHPKLFKIPLDHENHEKLLDLPYFMVLAIGTQDSIILSRTIDPSPFLCIKDMHLASITDITWSPDGLVLMISSTDGFCSTVVFEQGELGEYCPEEEILSYTTKYKSLYSNDRPYEPANSSLSGLTVPNEQPPEQMSPIYPA